MKDVWLERCAAQRVRALDGEGYVSLIRYGFVLARDALSVYPVGCFEVCGEVTVYPAQTFNTVEEENMLAVSTGLTRLWDRRGIITLRFVKQTDGSDFALTGADEELSREAEYLLRLRGLEDWGNALMEDTAGCESRTEDGVVTPPVLEEPTVVGASWGETLVIGKTVKDALSQLPEAAQKTLSGWFEKVLRHGG